MTVVLQPPVGPPLAAPVAGSTAVPADVTTAHTTGARWERPALGGLLVGTAVLYLWGLSASGWANAYYSAAAQAGAQSWKAFLFGSFDAASSITVDKPPLALWPMALSVRLFGLSPWGILVPQALMGVGAVAIVSATVRRRFGAAAGLLAGAALALTPVAALMFRFNNPDAALVLLMTAAAAALLKAIDDGRARWMLATGGLIGLAFLAKQLQALLIVPGFAVVYLVVANTTLRRRVTNLLLGGAAMIAGAGWWIAVVTLWPAGSRPYVGGSQTNSIWDLTFGYNGLGRLTGDETGSVGGGGPSGGWGQTGITRLADGVLGGQIAWLLPAAVVLTTAALWSLRGAPRTDARRALLVVFGGWLVVTWLVFSFMQGIFHEYYTVALAPPLAVLVAGGAAVVWPHRRSIAGALTLALATASTALWSASLLRRAPGWNAWLPTAVTIVGLVAAVGFLAGLCTRRPIAALAATGAVVAVLAGPAAWSVATAATPTSGAIVTAGPAVAGGSGPGGRGVPGGGAGSNGGGGFPGGAPPAQGQMPTRTGAVPGRMAGGTPGGGMGGLLGATEPSAELTALLVEDADDFTWIVATSGAMNAAGYQLATEQPVMAVGGFNGSDPSPTLEEFQADVAAGKIHWYLASGLEQMGSAGGSRESARIAEWVAATFTAQDVGGVTLYDLS